MHISSPTTRVFPTNVVRYDSVPNVAGWRIVFSSKGEQLVEVSSAKTLILQKWHSGVWRTFMRMHVAQDFI